LRRGKTRIEGKQQDGGAALARGKKESLKEPRPQSGRKHGKKKKMAAMGGEIAHRAKGKKGILRRRRAASFYLREEDRTCEGGLQEDEKSGADGELEAGGRSARKSIREEEGPHKPKGTFSSLDTILRKRDGRKRKVPWEEGSSFADLRKKGRGTLGFGKSQCGKATLNTTIFTIGEEGRNRKMEGRFIA